LSGSSASLTTSFVRLAPRDGCGYLDAGHKVELGEDAGDVKLHCPAGSKRSGGDVWIRQTNRHEASDLLLGWC
jgi:hypothetical protein